jgi:hypothetical protein
MFAKLVTQMQQVLCNAKNDWILYFQSEGTDPEFIVWVYPNKIMVSHEYEDRVRRLLNTPKQ